MKWQETKPENEAEPDHRAFCELRSLSFILKLAEPLKDFKKRRDETRFFFFFFKFRKVTQVNGSLGWRPEGWKVYAVVSLRNG